MQISQMRTGYKIRRQRLMVVSECQLAVYEGLFKVHRVNHLELQIPTICTKEISTHVN